MADKKKNVKVKVGADGVKVKAKGQKTKTIKYNSALFITIAVILLIAVISVLVVYFGFPNAWKQMLSLFGIKDATGNPEGELAIHFLDVGQGDCIIIQLPDGKNAIIDAGGDNKNNEGKSCETRILENINELKIKTFDYMFLTHTDADHVDYMDTVLKEYEVKNIYRPAFNSTYERGQNINPQFGTIETRTYNDFVKAVIEEQKEGAKVKFNIGKMLIEGEGYQFDIYGVAEEWYRKDKVGDESQIDAKERNKVSPMVLLSYNAKDAVRKVMFTGDSEGEGGNGGEGLFLEKYKTEIMTLDIDLLKVGHHGSASSASNNFLKRLDPEYAVISAGIDNKHKHPRPECLARLAEYTDGKGQVGIEVYNTQYCGDIIFRVNQKGDMSFAPDIIAA